MNQTRVRSNEVAGPAGETRPRRSADIAARMMGRANIPVPFTRTELDAFRHELRAAIMAENAKFLRP